MVGVKGKSGRKKKKNVKKHYRILHSKDEIIEAIKKRNLTPVRIKGTNFITIADIHDYYENSSPNKDKYEKISWDEFFKHLRSKNLIVEQNIHNGFIKIIKQKELKNHIRYVENPP